MSLVTMACISYYRHGVLVMDILELLRVRILEQFPHITHEELNIRLEYAYRLINQIK